MERGKVSRREFLRKGPLALAGSGLVIGGATRAAANKGGIRNERPGVPYRRFGRTDIRLSAIALGGIRMDERVHRRGIERGINFVHMSLTYSRGQDVKKLARILKTERDKVYVAFKVTFGERIDEALEALGIRTIDIVCFPCHDPASARDPRNRERFARWKKQGKARHMALTTHGRVIECVEAGIASGMYEAIMPASNQQNLPRLLPLFEEAAGKGISVFPMKTLQGFPREGLDLRKAQIKRVLAARGVTSIIKAMRSFEEFDAYLATAAETLTRSEASALERLREAKRGEVCAMCATCMQACPRGLEIPDMLRTARYYLDELGDLEHAAMTYRAIPVARSFARCEDCGSCERACPNGLPIRRDLRRAHRLFGGDGIGLA